MVCVCCGVCCVGVVVNMVVFVWCVCVGLVVFCFEFVVCVCVGVLFDCCCVII